MKNFFLTRHLFALILLVCLVFGSRTATAQYTNLPITGFNQDEVANGVGVPTGSATNSLDAGTGTTSGFAFIDGTYKYSAACATGVFATGILPASNTISGVLAPSLPYLLQTYSGLNTIRIPLTGTGTGSMNVGVTGGPTASTLYMLCVSGGGAIT